ncbi:protein-L-isoaspartate O-methyltransferase [Nocardiopsis mwathae]|uniref:Protein-L-isoaspartate O-methyltransferase n=1 Tax=Nocardiopsis mwathae TaxID=1472723 RepID=A0A7W9YHG3_9ACTN|nr:protein-L-isoaspartate O-methyltransferase [Nocardiopsis mwathae]
MGNANDALYARHTNLVAELDTTEEIRTAFNAHPRHHFIPDLIWPTAMGPPVSRDANPDAWAETVYRDDAVTTQTEGTGSVNVPTSSSSAPQVMADMIRAAGVRPGMRVLEVGTGTGWNAAILAELVGTGGSVTTVEVDPGVADAARHRLAGTGVRVVTGTRPPGTGEFDAVLVTCAVTRIPDAWALSAAPGGVMVLPWAPAPHAETTPIAALSIDGHRWSGAFIREGSFMRCRDQPRRVGRFPGIQATPQASGVFPATSEELLESDLMTPLMLTLPGLRFGVGMRPFNGDPRTIVYVGAPDGSWAYVWPDATVTMGGPTPVAERLDAAYRQLTGSGARLEEFQLEAGTGAASYRVVLDGVGSWDYPVARFDQAE